MVMPEATVRVAGVLLLIPLTKSLAWVLVPPRTICPLPDRVWVPSKFRLVAVVLVELSVRVLLRVRPFLAVRVVALLTVRSAPRVTPSRMLVPVLVRVAPPLELMVPPVIVPLRFHEPVVEL